MADTTVYPTPRAEFDANIAKFLGEICAKNPREGRKFGAPPKGKDLIDLPQELQDTIKQEKAPEEVEHLRAFENQTEDLRTVTMVFHAGTKKEKVEQVQAPKGFSIWMVLPDDATESFSIYADAACTEPYQSNGDYTSDVTVYIK